MIFSLRACLGALGNASAVPVQSERIVAIFTTAAQVTADNSFNAHAMLRGQCSKSKFEPGGSKTQGQTAASDTAISCVCVGVYVCVCVGMGVYIPVVVELESSASEQEDFNAV